MSNPRDAFIERMIGHAAPVAVRWQLPAAAMIACAVVESGYGSSEIYRITGSPFNLQKPDWYKWVHCQTRYIRTGVQTDASGKVTKTLLAPFCLAEGATEEARLADAARIWCEWVLNWPQTGVRNRVLGMRHRPDLFAQHLPLLGFGEAAKARRNGEIFLHALNTNRLVERCAQAAAAGY